MSSPITSSDFDIQNFSGDICERLKKLLELNNTLREFFEWFLSADGSEVSSAFKALIQDIATPVGGIIFHPMAAVPAGYLIANGQAVSRTIYANLYAVYGVFFGAGDGSTTFNLPDLQSKFLIGSTGGSGSYPTASTGGAATVVLTQPQLPAQLTNLNQDMHNAQGSQVAMGTFKPLADDYSENGAVLSSQVLPTINNPGGGQGHPNIPPYFAVLVLVKT